MKSFKQNLEERRAGRRPLRGNPYLPHDGNHPREGGALGHRETFPMVSSRYIARRVPPRPDEESIFYIRTYDYIFWRYNAPESLDDDPWRGSDLDILREYVSGLLGPEESIYDAPQEPVRATDILLTGMMYNAPLYHVVG